ncbi:MAG: flagellar basal body-associated FliL family protein [Gammaproteobacteria bacterium]|nr:flagellar basal body-associated FliL family protein [Gammaproteobacteria bacterium]
MAEKKTEASESEGAESEAPGNKKKKMMLLLILGGLGVTSIAGTALFMTGVIGHKKVEAEQPQGAVANVKKVPVYFAFDKPITVNFETESGLRFLQVELEVMTYDPLVPDQIKTHMPVIRNELIMIFSSQDYGDLISQEGKDKIRSTVLSKLQAIMTEKSGKPGIEEVYFTNFVIQ